MAGEMVTKGMVTGGIMTGGKMTGGMVRVMTGGMVIS